jgi:hypothetical protein
MNFTTPRAPDSWKKTFVCSVVARKGRSNENERRQRRTAKTASSKAAASRFSSFSPIQLVVGTRKIVGVNIPEEIFVRILIE